MLPQANPEATLDLSGLFFIKTGLYFLLNNLKSSYFNSIFLLLKLNGLFFNSKSNI